MLRALLFFQKRFDRGIFAHPVQFVFWRPVIFAKIHSS